MSTKFIRQDAQKQGSLTNSFVSIIDYASSALNSNKV